MTARRMKRPVVLVALLAAACARARTAGTDGDADPHAVVARAQAFMDELKQKGKVEVLLVQPRADVPIPAEANVLGPEKAPVTIVEFSDYLCPYCQRAEGTVKDVLARYEGKVRFVHRDF